MLKINRLDLIKTIVAVVGPENINLNNFENVINMGIIDTMAHPYAEPIIKHTKLEGVSFKQYPITVDNASINIKDKDLVFILFNCITNRIIKEYNNISANQLTSAYNRINISEK